jgi:hypothetical protein
VDAMLKVCLSLKLTERTEKLVKQFFSMLEKVTAENRLSATPGNIFNVDKFGI